MHENVDRTHQVLASGKLVQLIIQGSRKLTFYLLALDDLILDDVGVLHLGPVAVGIGRAQVSEGKSKLNSNGHACLLFKTFLEQDKKVCHELKADGYNMSF